MRQKGGCIPCLGLPIARRSLRLHSIGLLSRWQQPQVGTASHSRAPGNLSRLAWNRTAPSSSAAPGCGSPEPHNTLWSVTSTANWAPLKQGRSCAKTSMRLSSSARTLRFMSLKNALCTSPEHQLRGRFGPTCALLGVARFRTRPDRVHGSMLSVCVQRFMAPVANSLRDWERQVQPLQE